MRRHESTEPITWEPYNGETTIDEIIIRKGKKIIEDSFKPDKVKAVAWGNAYIIGNGPSRKGFDLDKLKRTGQTYGCNALYRDFIPDFLFMVDSKISKEVADNNVHKKCWVYTPSLEVNRYPGFVLIPNNQYTITGNQAMWTATVHGHKNIYLVGFDFREYGKDQLNNIYQDTENYGERHSDTIFEPWLKFFRNLLKMRPYCNFTIVHDNPPDYLHHVQTGTELGNSKIITYKEFNDTVLSQPL